MNVTLLFTRGQYLAAAEAYLRGVERRIEAGLSPRVCSVASLFISRWDGATAKSLPAELANRLGIAVGETCYQAYRDLLAGDRFERLCSFGAVPQRLLFASTGTKDPALSPCLYVEALAAANSINTMPEKTLQAFAEHGRVAGTLSAGGGLGESVIAAVERAGVDVAALGEKLQRDGAEAFVKSWDELLGVVEAKSRVAAGKGA